MDAVFKALADESRRRILDVLHEESGVTLVEICARFDDSMTRQAVSKHVGILVDANLVVVVKKGRENLHYLNAVPIHDIYERWIHKFERHRLQALAALKRRLEEEDR